MMSGPDRRTDLLDFEARLFEELTAQSGQMVLVRFETTTWCEPDLLAVAGSVGTGKQDRSLWCEQDGSDGSTFLGMTTQAGPSLRFTPVNTDIV